MKKRKRSRKLPKLSRSEENSIKKYVKVDKVKSSILSIVCLNSNTRQVRQQKWSRSGSQKDVYGQLLHGNKTRRRCGDG